RDPLDAPVPLGVTQLLLEGAIRLRAWTRVRLANEDLEKGDRLAPPGEQLLHRLDRADRRGSRQRPEANEHWFPTHLVQANGASADQRELEVRRRLAGTNDVRGDRVPHVGGELLGREPSVVVFVDGLLPRKGPEPITYVSLHARLRCKF